ncbi:MAG: hypothetical protein LCH38_09365 [Proteobacteria bacterium]|nr:hypothetical protein [Pseudomonadota bacterium]
MDDFVSFFASVPSPVAAGIAAGIGFGIGHTAGNFLRRWIANDFLPLILGIGIMTAMSGVISGLSDHARAIKSTEDNINILKKNAVFGKLFAIEPHSEKEFYNSLLGLIKSKKATKENGEKESRSIITKYLNKNIPNASAETIINLLSWNAYVVNKLQNEHKGCMDYYSGTRIPDSISGLDQAEIIARDGELKIAIIESALKNPETFTPYESTDALNKDIILLYDQSKQSKADLALLAKAEELPPQDGCRVARSFLTALATGDPAIAVRILKHVTVLLQKQK